MSDKIKTIEFSFRGTSHVIRIDKITHIRDNSQYVSIYVEGSKNPVNYDDSMEGLLLKIGWK